MRKLLSIILIAVLVIAIAGTFLEVNAVDLCNVSITTQNQTITEGQKQVVIQINLDEYNGAGDLGYQGTLEYDKNIFENVTIVSFNDWENIDYEESTGNFISTTQDAKSGTKIAEITLTLKDGITAQDTTVSINNLMFSDAETNAIFNQSITFNFAQNMPTEEPDNDSQEQPESNPEEQPGDNQEEGPENNPEEQPDTNPDAQPEEPDTDNNPQEQPENNQEEEPENNPEEQPEQTPEVDDETPEEPNNGDEETSDDNIIVISNNQINPNDTIIIEGATNEDTTTATSSIPQTGGISILIIVGIIAVLGIACYIRYRTIQVK